MVGIITLYYENYNLGGLLQAYALQHYIENNIDHCEQICILKEEKKEGRLKRIQAKTYRSIAHPVLEFQRKKNQREQQRNWNQISSGVLNRVEKMKNFASHIPHSDEVYKNSDIKKSLERYSSFVVGSDQVWNNNFKNVEGSISTYLLEFVPEAIKKVSYAASFGRDISANKAYCKRVNESLLRFNSISLREESSMSFLIPENQAKSQVLIDPTMLLSAEHWEKMECKEKIPSEKYIFAYFLGNKEENRAWARKVAEENHVRLVAFIHTQNCYNRCDDGFADLPMTDYSIGDFIALIHHSSIVITDSYHATVFSILFHKNFYAMDRGRTSTQERMNSRLLSLLSYFHLKNHYIEAYDWIPKSMKKHGFEDTDDILNEEREKAKMFFREAFLKN